MTFHSRTEPQRTAKSQHVSWLFVWLLTGTRGQRFAGDAQAMGLPEAGSLPSRSSAYTSATK